MSVLKDEEEDATVFDHEGDADTSSSVDDTSEESESSDEDSQRPRRVTVTFGVTAADEVTAVDNVKGWRVSWLSKTYSKIAGETGITKRGDFRVRPVRPSQAFCG